MHRRIDLKSVPVSELRVATDLSTKKLPLGVAVAHHASWGLDVDGLSPAEQSQLHSRRGTRARTVSFTGFSCWLFQNRKSGVLFGKQVHAVELWQTYSVLSNSVFF